LLVPQGYTLQDSCLNSNTNACRQLERIYQRLCKKLSRNVNVLTSFFSSFADESLHIKEDVCLLGKVAHQKIMEECL
jgi:hypothetical protein